jgi:ATP-dependent Lon protease
MSSNKSSTTNKSTKKIYNTRALKKAKQDSDSESEKWTDEDDESVDDSSSEEEATTDSSYKPHQKSKKKIVIESSDDDDDESSDKKSTGGSSSSSASDNSSSKKVSRIAFQKMLSNMFPSKYIDKKVSATEKINQLKHTVKPNNKPVSTKTLRKFMKTVPSSESEDIGSEDSDRSSDSESNGSFDESKSKKKSSKKRAPKKHKAKLLSHDESDDDDSDSDYEDTMENDPMKHVNIIFSGFEGEYGDEGDLDILEEDDNVSCNSEDEQTFMKDQYEKIETAIETNKQSKDNTDKSKNKKHKSKDTKSSKDKKNKEIKEEDKEPDNENEYSELIELKKHLRDKLEKKPDSKILKQAIKECKESISKLVMKGRSKNAQKYYDLIHGEQKNTSELEYFKKKLSNKEQLRIMKELVEINSYINIDKPYRLSLLESNIPPKYKATVMQKLNILKQMDPGDTEYYKIKNWVDTFMRVPFGKYKELSVKMSDGMDTCSRFMCEAKDKLDNCVYGLNDAKLQILQMVGQWITNPNALGTAIAIKGPPGTGKSSLVKDGISQILGREFAFIALGGSGDSSFLEGHSYTYEGSSWGKIVQILIDSKCMNPIIYFDELDKISETPRGEEIVGILTHLTDTTQNNEFHDKYFSEVDFDLSKCLFIFSYNDESKVNPILRDRMYRIQTKGYSAKEKVIIARKHLLPKIREQVSFQESDVQLPDETLMYIITNKALTQDEAGVRNLKRCLEIIHTKLNLFRLVHQDSEIFKKEMDLKVSFPMTVSCKDVDALIKNDENQSQSMLAMYV